MDFNIEFYRDKESNRCYIEEFLDSLDIKAKVHTLRNIQLLANFDNALREPYSKSIDDGIFELCIKHSSNVYRVLYFFYKDKNIILTNVFIKKQVIKKACIVNIQALL